MVAASGVRCFVFPFPSVRPGPSLRVMTMTESHDALAHLAWQVELGADEAILDAPVNRFEAAEKASPVPSSIAQAIQAPAPPPVAQVPDKAADAAVAVAQAEALAASARSLPELQAALAGFEQCELRHGARNLVFLRRQPGGPRDDRGRGTGAG
jgi:hypothetical protein